MKVLWVCNISLPVIAEYYGMEVSNKEGWLSGLVKVIMDQRNDNKIDLYVAFPYQGQETIFAASIPYENAHITCYGFEEDIANPEKYSDKLEENVNQIIEDCKPDVIHCFGTEYSHTLAITKVVKNSGKVLIGIQGLCAVYAKAYMASLPQRVQNRVTFRDFLKKDSIKAQQKKFVLRGEHEKEAIERTGNVTGRTHWDRYYTGQWNPKARYFFMNETLRSNFYEGIWNMEQCEPYSIFVSQGDYPIKGLHYVLRAMPTILAVYPKAKVYIAGNSLVKNETWKDRIKRSSYGKYILELIQINNLTDKVSFLGKLNADEMKEQYLKSNLFLCPSSIENSPNSIGEAMLLGVPVVSARVGGIESICVDNKDGILYDGFGENDRDKQEEEDRISHNLAQAVCSMWSDSAKMLQLSHNAREHARTTHDPQHNYETLMQIYQEIAK